jgi:hypothetical protein
MGETDPRKMVEKPEIPENIGKSVCGKCEITVRQHITYRPEIGFLVIDEWSDELDAQAWEPSPPLMSRAVSARPGDMFANPDGTVTAIVREQHYRDLMKGLKR